MTRRLSLIAAALTLSLSTPLAANVLVDTYWGSKDHGYQDVIGLPAYFDVHSATAFYTSSTSLVVEIATNFVAYVGVFPELTTASPHPEARGNGIGIGDLFLSVGSYLPNYAATAVHDPDGSRRLKDNSSNGHHWSYGFAIGDALRWSTPTADSKGQGLLYALPDATPGNANPGALRSNAYMNPTGALYRNDQAVAVNTTASTDTGNNGEWYVDLDTKLIRFELDVTGTGLAFSDLVAPPLSLALHWGMTCANDVIQGALTPTAPPQTPPGGSFGTNSVPEPATLALLGLGLLGIGGARRARRAGG